MPRSLIEVIIPPAVKLLTPSETIALNISCGVIGEGTSMTGREASSSGKYPWID
jgi:hypothetical protein